MQQRHTDAWAPASVTGVRRRRRRRKEEAMKDVRTHCSSRVQELSKNINTSS